MSELPGWFRMKFEKLMRLAKEREIKFFGIGCMPTDKSGVTDYEVWELFGELLDFGPFLEAVRSGLFKDYKEPMEDW